MEEVAVDQGPTEFAWDDVNKIPLPIELVRKARSEEINHMKRKASKVVKRSEAWAQPPHPPHDEVCRRGQDAWYGRADGRSRWVARAFKDKREKDRADLFSATPPTELMRCMLPGQASRGKRVRSARLRTW